MRLAGLIRRLGAAPCPNFGELRICYRKSKSHQNARIITAQPLIASIIATIIAFNAGSNSLIKTINAEIKTVANITSAGAITHGILSAMSKRFVILSV